MKSKVLNIISIEELEERLEFGRWGCDTEAAACPPFHDGYGCTATIEAQE